MCDESGVPWRVAVLVGRSDELPHTMITTSLRAVRNLTARKPTPMDCIAAPAAARQHARTGKAEKAACS